MLSTAPAVCQPLRHPPFLLLPWPDDHPDWQRLDAALPPDHPARLFASVVSRLDLQPLRQSYAGRGSPPYPPEPLLAFVLFLHASAVLSPAAWARQARYDTGCHWLLRGLCPSRSQLYTFRDRLEPFLDGWHQQLIAWAIAEQVTTACRGSLDGSFVAALASRHRLLRSGQVDRRLLLLRLLVWLESGPGEEDGPSRLRALPERLLSGLGLWLGLLGNGFAVAPLAETLLALLTLLELLGTTAGPLRLPAWVPATPAGRRRVLARYQDAQRRLAERLRPYQDKPRMNQKEGQTLKRVKVSLTDPEAALGWDKVGTYRPLYNVLLVQATDAPLTLAWDVLPRANDDGLLRPLMEKTQAQLGRPLAEVLVDRAFVSVSDVAWCERQGIVVYAPPEREGGTGTKASPGKPKPAKYPKEAFRYDRTTQRYSCPQGKPLPEAYRTTERRTGGVELVVITHRAAGTDCQACVQQPHCTSNPRKGRVVKRYEGEEAVERLAERMATAAAQAVYRERSRSVELGYADVKAHRGLRVFHGFGQRRARTQVGLVILASNGLKLVRALQRRQGADPAASTPQKQPA